MKKYLLLFLICVYASIGAWAGEVSYPFTFGDGNLSKVEKVDFGNNQYGLVVTIGNTGDFAIFANMLGNSGDSYISSNYLNYGRLRIVCTNGAVINATDVATYESKMSNAPLTCLDLTDAAFDADATITSFIANGVAYVALPQGKDISDVTLKDDGTIKGVVTSNGSSAIYTAYNGAADANFSTLFIGSSLQNIGTWTITNGAASGSSITAGAETGHILTAIVSNSTATTLNITLDGITNSPTTLAPSSSITNLTISGIQYPNQYESLTINGGSALTTLTLEDTTIPGSLTIGGCPELVTADLRGVRKKPNGGSTKLDVTVNNDPKLSNLILYKSSTETGCNVSGTTRPVGSGLTVTYALPAIPIEYDDCKVTINLSARNGATMSDLISDAETELAKSNTNICTLIVTGELTTTDLQSLDDANTATRIDLSETTLATGAAITSLQVPSNLESLVLPPNQTVKGTTLANTLSTTNFPNLLYAYSPSSDCTATGPNQTNSYDDTNNTIADYVWVNQAGGLKQAFENEEQLRNSFYIKVASDVALTQTDVDFNGCTNKPTNYLFLDFSESNLTPSVAASYTVTDNIGYRIILPNGWSGNQMAVFAANPNCGNLAAVYSYDGTTLKIMEIVDASYSQAALANPRIMRSGTTEVDIVSGYYNGNTYATFGTNLLAALNNMGKINFTVGETNYTNTVGTGVTKISIETTSAAPSALTFDNPSVETIEIKNFQNTNVELNVDACSALTTLNLTSSSLKTVDASTTSLTTANLAGTSFTGVADFSGATSLATFNTSDETRFGGDLNLTSSALTSLISEATFGGSIYLNASNNLESINLSGATWTLAANDNKKLHIDKDATEADGNTDAIDKLHATADAKTIKLPSSFEGQTLSDRIHPYSEVETNVEVASKVAPAVTFAASDKVFHDKETGEGDVDKFRYWYADTQENANKEVTLGTSDSRTLTSVLTDNTSNLNFGSTTYNKVKVVGPVTSADVARLDDLNCIALDLSEATFDASALTALKTALANTSTLAVHSNVKFLYLPDGSTRDELINATALAGLANSVYCVMSTADNATDGGIDLTSYSFKSGSLQPAVTIFLNSAASSWTGAIKEGYTARNKYTSSVSTFKNVKIGGLINTYDLSHEANQKVDENGHLSRIDSYVIDAQGHISKNEYYKEQSMNWDPQWLNGTCNVYGPFSSAFQLTEIDLRDAYFEQVNGGTSSLDTDYIRYYNSDMTLAALGIISTATRKVVIPQTSTVHEVPADFMNCACRIRAIMIPSNIFVIRTRAFYTMDYVWTNSGTADPEGTNTRLDNGTQYKENNVVGEKVYATQYDANTHKFVENPNFDYTKVCYGGTYTFGSSIKMIETAAFANTQPHVKDVYVLNTTAPECHVDAFNTVMYCGNGGYNPVITNGIITRESYGNNGFWITMLHYPRQTGTPNTQRYTDPTREYSIATGERDGKGAIIYFPNQSEFNRAYNQGTYGYTWNAWNTTRINGNSIESGEMNVTEPWKATSQTAANTLWTNNTATNKAETSFYDVTYTEIGGESNIASSQPSGLTPYYQVTRNSTQLYLQNEIDANNDADNSGEKTSRDYRGWHQFVLNAFAANTILDEEPYRSYITDNEWWTICPEFDITYSESAILFGTANGVTTSGPTSYPYISKLQYVTRDYGRETISLCFSKNLNTQRETFYEGSKHGITDEATGILVLDANHAFNANDVVMKAGVPYLIKPSFSPGAVRQFRIFRTGADLAKYTEANPESNVIAFASESLYTKIQVSQSASGTSQMAEVKAGTYTVPVFVSEYDGEGLVKESVEMVGENPKIFTIGDINYHRSTEYHYTFVGTFYKSFLPHYSYFLGWDSSLNSGNGGARFFYHNGNFPTIDNEMRWANGTGVIVPVKSTDLDENGKFKHSVTPASGKNPAQWSLLETFLDDSFVSSSSGASSVKAYNMIFDAPDITPSDSDVTGISNVETEDSNILDNVNVYSVNGQKVGTSLEGLPKGIYIVNGKKFIVK